MFRQWLTKRKLKRYLKGCNFEMAKMILEEQFEGTVIRNDLSNLLDAFLKNPTTNTAIDLILYDSEFIAVFDLARSGGFTEHLFTQGDLK